MTEAPIFNEIDVQLKSLNWMEAEKLLNQIKNGNSNKKRQCLKKISVYENKIENLKRESLFGNKVHMNTNIKNEEDTNTKILQNTYGQLLETIKTGEETLLQLQRQKEVLIRAKEDLTETQIQLKKSEGILTRMSGWWI